MIILSLNKVNNLNNKNKNNFKKYLLFIKQKINFIIFILIIYLVDKKKWMKIFYHNKINHFITISKINLLIILLHSNKINTTIKICKDYKIKIFKIIQSFPMINSFYNNNPLINNFK